MKIFRNFLALTATIIALSIVSVNAQSFSGGRNLEQQIFKKLNGLPYYGVFDHIAYKVDGSTVTLYGKVNSLGTKSDAERVVKRIPGVTRVVNNIQNLPPSSFDNSIRRQLVRKFASTGGIYRYLREPSPSVRLIVDRGNVTLEGYVANRGDYNVMNILANGVLGVFSVTNNLVIEKEMVR